MSDEGARNEAPSHSPAGLCHRCAHTRLIVSDRGSRFYLCALSESDPRFPKYPRLPVLKCDGFKPKA